MGSASTKSKKKKTELTPKKIIEHNRKLSRNSLKPGPYKQYSRREKKSPTRSQTISYDITLSYGTKRRSKLKTKYA